MDGEAPETPAHLFALKAFKNALFGTPAPQDTQHKTRARRMSAHERAGHNTRDRPTSSHAAIDTGIGSANTFGSSPTKRPGILLTPGTAGARRKTVSFDGHRPAIGAKAREPAPDPTPRDLQGEFPATWITKDRKRPESDFARRLKGDKDASRRELGSRTIVPEPAEAQDPTLDINEPRSASGKYWKSEFDMASAKTATDIRKLTKKEQVAKTYAKHRDSAAEKLADELRQEQKKVARLEQQVNEFAEQLAQAMDAQRRQGKEPADTSRSSRRTLAEHLPSQDRQRKEREDAAYQLELLEHNNQRLETALEASKTELVGTTKAKELEVSRLRGENEALRAELDAIRRQSSRSHRLPNTSSTQPVQDIWADAPGPGPREASPRRKHRSERERPALSQRNPNPGSTTQVERKDAKESRLSDERKEAARKRLEERRRNRAREAVTTS